MTLAEVEEILRSMRLRFTRHGYRIRSQCPCHEDNEPSLIIDWRGGEIRVKCFAGCDRNRIMDALRLRRQNIQTHVPDYHARGCNISQGLSILSCVLSEAIKLENPLAEKELARRGISVNRYGVVDARTLVRLLIREDPYRLVESGLAYWKFNELRFPRVFSPNRVVIPYWREGRIVSLRSRKTGNDDTPKYLSLRGYPSQAYIARVSYGTILVVVEGEFKAMVLADHLPEEVSVIGLPGVNNAWKDLMELCKTYSFRRRIVMFDTERNNAQVQKAARRLALKIGGDIVLLELLEGEDRMAPDDFIMRFGSKQLEETIMRK